MKKHNPSEPSFSTACDWWPDLPNIWTPLGWRDHMFRFNVLWNGTILAQPHMNRRTEAWKGLGAQLSFVPHWTNAINEYMTPYLRHDDGQITQGWTDDYAPVLWSEWSRDGLLLRTYAFAHVPAGETQTGSEPMFAWVRLAVHDRCPSLPLEDRHGFHLLLHAPHASTSMENRSNVRFHPERCRYPRELRPDAGAYDPAAGLRILEPDGSVRLAVAPGPKDVTAEFLPPASPDEQAAYRFYLQMPARAGAHVDVLLPMLPCDRETLDAELCQGRHIALRHARTCWRKFTGGRTLFYVPEFEINDIIRHSVRFSNVLTERNPVTGKLCKINGSWTYADLWTTPGSMDLAMMLDPLGHHKLAERYLDIFKDEQGTVTPPGDAYEPHPGYLSTPAAYKSIDWLSDNGAVLWTICSHYLMSGDRAFLNRFIDCIVKSCDWIKSARAKTGHGGYEGVLPPAIATDSRTKIQAVWTIGWNYKGLAAAVRILREIGHPRAAEFEAEAADYREKFVAALRHKCATMPVWECVGEKCRFVPTALAGDDKAESRHAFYLDTGPLFLVFAGLMDADDPLMRDTLAWFRFGPQTRFYRRDSNAWQVPVLDHEMSSCEPCYSWNVFHSWQLGDKPKFLEGMYSLFAGAISRKTWISCETRGGITGNVFAAPLAIWMARLAVIDDQIRPGELHLLRLIPEAWLQPDDECRFENVPTEFGPVTLRTKLASAGGRLAVEFRPKFRSKPSRILLHVPDAVKYVSVNGKRQRERKDIIEISPRPS